MRRKRGILFLVMAIALVFAGALAVIAAEGTTQAPEKITIKSALWPNPTKSVLEFTHKKHAEDYKVACTECHHVFQDGKNVWKEGDPVQKCDACHTEPTIKGVKKLPPDQQKLNLYLAFHTNCIDCHKKLKKEKPDTTVPVTCAGCHPGAKEDKE